MQRIFNITLMVMALMGCTSNVPSSPAATVTAQVAETAAPPEKPTWAIYDPDPDHIWNRVFRQFYRRAARDGKEYGLGELDPLLWFDTTYLLSGGSHQQAIRVLDEFLGMGAETLIGDALRRAMFQRDLWAVFDWLSFQSDSYASERKALETRLTQIIQRVALTSEQIQSLPDNYALAVQSNIFPADHQAGDPLAAFLPADLFQPDSAWVPMGREGGPIAMSHTNEFPFFGRSVFLVFVRSPDGRTATLDLIQSLNTDRRPVLTTGTDIALVRRMLLIDNQGNLMLSPLIETIQIRHFNPEQIFHELELDRPGLFKGASGLQLNTDLFLLFFSHGDEFQFSDRPKQATIPDICKGCHVNIPAVLDRGNIESILSYSRANFPLPDDRQPILFATTWMDEAKTVIDWKLNHGTWQTLKSLWNH